MGTLFVGSSTKSRREDGTGLFSNTNVDTESRVIVARKLECQIGTEDQGTGCRGEGTAANINSQDLSAALTMAIVFGSELLGVTPESRGVTPGIAVDISALPCGYFGVTLWKTRGNPVDISGLPQGQNREDFCYVSYVDSAAQMKNSR
jgi:hypothetical protein